MIIWSHYPDIDPIRRLKYSGDELIGKSIIFEEKRDGSNVSLWFDDSDIWKQQISNYIDPEINKDIVNNIHISSHNNENADKNLISNIIKTSSYKNACKFLLNKKSNKNIIMFGELLCRGKSPTKIEEIRKEPEWILFDIFDTKKKVWYDYSGLEKISKENNIILINKIKEFTPKDKNELNSEITKLLDWCKINHREGIVGKVYNPIDHQVFFKEKIEIKIERKNKKIDKPKLPPMPREKIIRALQHAFDELVKISERNKTSPDELWKDRSIVMPLVAKHLRLEGEEHGFEVPNPYIIYLNVPLEEIK